MQGNNISVIDNDIVSKVSQLKTLDLRENDLQTISNESFKSQSDLYRLILSHNKIKYIANDAFEGLEALQVLKLNGNKITKIASSMFNSLTNLKELDLDDNDISLIEEKAFQGMRNILHLDLRRNKIKRIPTDTFGHLLSLQELHLSENYIKVVPSDAFIPRGNLTLLDISNNNISTLENKANASPLSASLETLITHNNDISSMAGWLTHSALPSLKILEMSHNKLRGRVTNTAWPRSLEQVDVSENDIEDLIINISDTLGIKTSLKQLDTSSNQITTISIANESNPEGDGLISLYLGENPFHCDCNLIWLQELITSQSSITSSYVIRDSDRLYCQTILRHEPGPMKDIKPENFLCEYNVSCPKLCTCYQNEMSSDVNIVDCKGSNITVLSDNISDNCTMLDLSGNAIVIIETGTFERLAHLGELLMNSSQIAKIGEGAFRNLTDLIKLDLANNKLQTLENEMFEGLVRLEVLDLSENKINHIREGSLQPMKALKQLNLRNNQLRTISKSEFEFLSQIQSVQLAQNPWSCDCVDVELMKQFMINNSKHIDDVHDVTCESYDSETRKTMTHQLLVHKHEFCVDDADAVDKTNDNVPMIVVITVMSVIIIGLIAFITSIAR